MATTIADFFTKISWILSIVLLCLIVYYLINIGNNYVPDRKRIKISNRKVLPMLGGILFLYILFSLFKRYNILSDLFFTIVLSAIIAYILNPLVGYFQSKGMKRSYAVITIYLIILGIVFILAFLVVPSSSREIRKLINNMPYYFNNIKAFVDRIYSTYNESLGDLPPIFQGVESAILTNIAKIEDSIGNGLRNFVQALINSLSKIITYILTPILTFYFLVDKDVFKKKLKDFIPLRYRDDVIGLAHEIDSSVSNFIRGRLIMAISVGIVTTIFLLFMGVDFAMVIGFITAIADIIPYIGPFIGFIPAVVFAFMASPIKAFWVAIFFVLIQWAENNLLGPKILGDSTGIHPLVVLLSILVGGGLFGVAGMILSVPFVAISKIFFEFIRKKLNKPPEEML